MGNGGQHRSPRGQRGTRKIDPVGGTWWNGGVEGHWTGATSQGWRSASCRTVVAAVKLSSQRQVGCCLQRDHQC